MKTFFLTSAVVECAAGLGFLLDPAGAAGMLGASADSALGLVAGRLFGAAAAALGLICFGARSDTDSRLARVILFAMAFYNLAAMVLLLQAKFGLGMTGIVVLPGALLHLGLLIGSVSLAIRMRPRAGG